MMRRMIGKPLDHDPDFRWRGEAVTRIENLSDIAFALALGMLISGVDAPRTFEDLLSFLLFVIPAAAGFAVLLGIWTAHYTFFRRYGVADLSIIFLNALLIFLVLYMAYPLRFVFDSLFGWVLTMVTGDYSRSMEIGVLTFETSGQIIAVFATIYGVAFVILGLMYRHIIRKREHLALNAYELAVTRQAHLGQWLSAGLGFLTAAVGYFTMLNGFAGFLLSLNSVVRYAVTRIHPLPAGDSLEADHSSA